MSKNTERKYSTSISGIQYEGWPIDKKPIATIDQLSDAARKRALKRRQRNAIKQERGRRNRRVRADLNRETCGEKGNKLAGMLNERLRALKLGTL